MSAARPFAIQSFEFSFDIPNRDLKESHMFLTFRDMTAAGPTSFSSDSEVHFVLGTNNTLRARPGGRSERLFSDLDHPHIYAIGNEASLRPVWNRALAAAVAVNDLHDEDVPYGYADAPESLNCRAGVKAMAEAMGFEFVPRVTRGSKTDLFGMVAEELTVPKKLGLEAERLRTKELIRTLRDGFQRPTAKELEHFHATIE